MDYHDGMATTKVFMLNRHNDPLITYLQRGLDGLDIEIQRPTDDTRETLLRQAEHAHVLIGWGSDLEMLERARNLKLFINPGTGITHHLDNFRKLRAANRDVVLANGHGNSYAVAQHTVALLLALTNKVIPYHLKRMEYREPASPQHTVYLKNITVGLLSYGAINSKVHRLLSGFDVKFAACRRSWSDDATTYPTGLEKFTSDQLTAFCQHSDIVINALPHTQHTHELMTMQHWQALGEKGLFVNVGRGATVIEADLYHALKQGVIAGAALEVWWKRGPKPEDEHARHDPYSPEHPFHELDNVVMSPHRAADSGGSLDRWDEVIENLKRVHAGRRDYLNVVDLDREY